MVSLIFFVAAGIVFLGFLIVVLIKTKKDKDKQ
jgi:LPXTG-motif cell wall-anchored protein